MLVIGIFFLKRCYFKKKKNLCIALGNILLLFKFYDSRPNHEFNSNATIYVLSVT